MSTVSFRTRLIPAAFLGMTLICVTSGCVARDPAVADSSGNVRATIAQSPSAAGDPSNPPIRRISSASDPVTQISASSCSPAVNGVISCSLGAGDVAIPLGADARKQVISLRNETTTALRIGGVEDEASYCAWVETAAAPASSAGVRCLDSIVGTALAPGAALSLSIVSETAPSQLFISVSAAE